RRLQPRLVVPGHGAPFIEVDQALDRAFARLQALEASPERNARSVIKTLLKFHLLIVRQAALDELIARCGGWHYARIVNDRYFRLPFSDFIQRSVDELVAGGALELRDGVVANRDG
ncbi:MAG: MBL fold metallo-hydrolase, partial [Pseudomonadota bacterium]|nr:MBL fold metallo-hydrolase [Pseudomonadota bacterium]